MRCATWTSAPRVAAEKLGWAGLLGAEESIEASAQGGGRQTRNDRITGWKAGDDEVGAAFDDVDEEKRCCG